MSGVVKEGFPVVKTFELDLQREIAYQKMSDILGRKNSKKEGLAGIRDLLSPLRWLKCRGSAEV